MDHLAGDETTFVSMDARLPNSAAMHQSASGGNDEMFPSTLLEVNDRCEKTSCGSRLVIHSDNKGRALWNFILFVLLGYTGIVFPFVLCFLDFNVNEIDKAEGWKIVEMIVDVFFGIDLFINFFFTYEDRRGHDVDDLHKIVMNYLRTYFTLNLVACIPGDLVTIVVELVTESEQGGANLNKAARIMRLQRMSRLARLVRLARLFKMVSFFRDNSFWKQLQNLRGVRIINFVFGLLWAVHLLACGWYLVASLHSDVEDTWLERRMDARGVPLTEKSPSEQWFNSMYFVLTVFTTVGFGDMSAHTVPEILYVCMTMLLGAVVHSIIMSEVINVVTSIDQVEQVINQQKELVNQFAAHAGLDDDSNKQLTDWVTGEQAQTGEYDREAMRLLLSSGKLPRNLMERLPSKLYSGRLVLNRYLTACLSHTWQIPHRLPLLLAASVSPRHFFAEEIVYQVNDHPFSVFIILAGVFSHIARPSPNGGINEGPMQMMTVQHHGRKGKLPQVIGGGFLRHAQTEAAAEDMPIDPEANDLRPKDKSRDPSTTGVDSVFASANALQALRQNASAFFERSVATSQPMSTIAVDNSMDGEFSPYQLMCAGSYFGDCELLQPAPRRATVRCESTAVSLLLVRQDLQRLVDEFPQCARAWRMRAFQRERFREGRCKKQKRCISYRHLAALQVQQVFRRYRRKLRQRKLQQSADPISTRPCDGVTSQTTQGSLDDYAILMPRVLPGPPSDGSKAMENLEETSSLEILSDGGRHLVAAPVSPEQFVMYAHQVQELHREISDMRREMKDCFHHLRHSATLSGPQDSLSRQTCAMLSRDTAAGHGRVLPGVPLDVGDAGTHLR